MQSRKFSLEIVRCMHVAIIYIVCASNPQITADRVQYFKCYFTQCFYQLRKMSIINVF